MPQESNRLESIEAVEILRREHERLNQLFVDYFAARESRRYDLISEICAASLRHMESDTQILFPRLARTLDEPCLESNAVAEYEAVKELIDELIHPDPADFAFSQKVYRLAALVKEHVFEAEKPDGFFSRALSSSMDLAAVGSLLLEREQVRLDVQHAF